MNDDKAKILLLVEGPRTDYKLMQQLLNLYDIGDKYEIIPYNTNIYVLYKALFESGDSDSLDLLQVLKEKEDDHDKKKLFEAHYSDILLVFDLDPQDDLYSEDKILKMLAFFDESSENGKLYINYPMVEAFYHMKSIPDPDYFSYIATIEELKARKYKARVNRETHNNDYRKFVQSRKECDQVIIQNLRKAQTITHNNGVDDLYVVDSAEIYLAQAEKIRKEAFLYVLCTCVFFIFDYNPKLIKE